MWACILKFRYALLSFDSVSCDSFTPSSSRALSLDYAVVLFGGRLLSLYISPCTPLLFPFKPCLLLRPLLDELSAVGQERTHVAGERSSGSGRSAVHLFRQFGPSSGGVREVLHERRRGGNHDGTLMFSQGGNDKYGWNDDNGMK